MVAGALMVVLFFGGLGAWAAVAPLNAAVVGNGLVKVEGNRKSVQHLDGGIVVARVKEGDLVNAGEVLLTFSTTPRRAPSTRCSATSIRAARHRERLRAELARGTRCPSGGAEGRRRGLEEIWQGQMEELRAG